MIQRLAGSIGTALLAVVLQRSIAAGGGGDAAVAEAFAHTFWIALLLVAAALVPALLLPRAARSEPAQAPAAEGARP